MRRRKGEDQPNNSIDLTAAGADAGHAGRWALESIVTESL